MLQALLEERFRVKLRHESRETAAYVLALGKSGPRMKGYASAMPPEVTEATPKRMAGMGADGFFLIPEGYAAGIMATMNGRTGIVLARMPLASLCRRLAGVLKAPVVDRTGLGGRYDARLVFAADAAPVPADGEAGGGAPAASDPAPSLFRALEAQLGLKLEWKKTAVDFLVVESAERRPLEN